MGSTPIGISASRGAAVLGLSQFSSPVAVWAQIMEDRSPGFCAANGVEPPEPVDNAAVRWGTAFEYSVIVLAEQARGQKISSREELAEMDVAGVPITCHLDGIYEDGVLHEGKTTSSFSFRDAWGEPGTDHIPRAYQVQVQHQMMCSTTDSAIVSVLVFPTRQDEWEAAGLGVAHAADVDVITRDGIVIASCNDWARTLSQMGFFHQYRIEANHDLQAMMLGRYLDFWQKYVIGETPPPAESWDDVKRLIAEPRGTVVATEDQERLANEYRQIGDESAASKKQQDKIKALLLGAIGRGAEHPIDSDSVEAIVLRDRQGKKIASYSKGKDGRKTFRCGG